VLSSFLAPQLRLFLICDRCEAPSGSIRTFG
jgi:hypothetical protein